MKVKAKLNNLRISPRKVRLVADLVRGLDVADAKHQLHFLIKRSSKSMLKLLNSAIANAEHNFKLKESDLYISELFVNEGPTLKRIMPRAMGRAFHIRKRTSHITLVLEDKEKTEPKEKKEKNKLDKKIDNSKEKTEEVTDKKVKKSVKKEDKKQINKKDK